jgi:hypothetical protein
VVVQTLMPALSPDLESRPGNPRQTKSEARYGGSAAAPSQIGKSFLY